MPEVATKGFVQAAPPKEAPAAAPSDVKVTVKKEAPPPKNHPPEPKLSAKVPLFFLPTDVSANSGWVGQPLDRGRI